MVNPNNPEIRQRALDILREVLQNYEVDGALYDDRYRYSGMNGDFSEATRKLFETHVGAELQWPEDVFTFTYSKELKLGITPGRYYDTWMAWRAQRLKDFAQEVRQIVKQNHPERLFGLYVGSWYGEYPAFGNNYGSPNLEAGFWFLNDTYRSTGLAPALDLLITGCYYPIPTVYDALTEAKPIESTIEAAAALSNRVVRDQCWTYAGIMLSQFKDNPDGLKRALQAACAASQGVMVFDLSHDIEPLWTAFEDAFRLPANAPHTHPTLLFEVRKRRQEVDKTNLKSPPVIIPVGSPGTGL